ncbi:MAG: D-Ala-D-Ala carboxypeptidase family metallohydrolase [Roseobacter sp.]
MWTNFSLAEIACGGTDKLLIIRSAYRSPEHNRVFGGATRSKDINGAAFDVAMSDDDPAVLEAAVRHALRNHGHPALRQNTWAIFQDGEDEQRLVMPEIVVMVGCRTPLTKTTKQASQPILGKEASALKRAHCP